MKKCYKCSLDKPLTDFAKHSKRRDGLQSMCRLCQSGVNSARFESHKEDHYKRTATAKKKLSLEISELKRSRGCLLCEESEPCCLDFHHTVTEEKEEHVARFVLNGCRVKAFKEIEKCVVVCANHHRKIHAGLVSI